MEKAYKFRFYPTKTQITILNCQIGWNYGELEKPKEALKYLFKAEKLGKDDRMINID